ncbi:hypothetical protein CCE01nite_41920 [Cellulomonas cellasea]|uniref:DUF4474 domain-containing protein n=1 Tax=Cellulomonas cellasea TaxID=43670 RepID=A0A4Y3L1H4_9CELL|nr:hypothetical protein CCE01nite_41920 [Cellulomonas cellasea]
MYAAGFLYDPDQDIIYSRMDAPQRSFGYAYGYDDGALAMSAVIDCEPIFFDYAGKHWMVELWKGQYGLETGCEIGVYTRPIGSTGLGYAVLDATVGQRPNDDVPSHDLFYDCASDGDRLLLSAKLRRNGTTLFTRGPEIHWWLTGFRWGVLSDPSELSVDVSIRLKDAAMRDAFLGAIAGRPYSDLHVDGTTVSFTFSRPFAVPQPTRPAPALAAVRASNETIVSAYNSFGFPNNDPNQVDADFLSVAGLELLHFGDFVGSAAARAAIENGVPGPTVVAALADAFGIAGSTIDAWLNSVPRTLSSWVAEVQRTLALPLDFSCYVMIDNTKGPSDLLLTSITAAFGSYVMSPPARIARGSVGRFVLQDPKPSVFGSEGTVTYQYADENLEMKTVVFSFQCPTGFAANAAASTQPRWRFTGTSGEPDNPRTSPVPEGGHPLYVAFVIGGGAASEGRHRRVTSTAKDSGGDITRLCGAWGTVSAAQAILQITSGTVAYYTGAGPSVADVHVVDGRTGRYLRTGPDADPGNNLDELPDC